MHDSTFKSCSTKALEMHVLQLASWRWCKAVKTEVAHWQMRTDLIQKPCSHTWGAAYLWVWLISQYLQWFSFFKGSNTTTGPNSHIAIWQLMSPITTPPVCQWCPAIPKHCNIYSREFKRQQWQQQWCHKWKTICWMRKNNRAASVAIFFFLRCVVCQTTRWNFHNQGYDHNAQKIIPCLDMKTICAKQAKWHVNKILVSKKNCGAASLGLQNMKIWFYIMSLSGWNHRHERFGKLTLQVLAPHSDEQCDQHGIVAKPLTHHKVLFRSNIFITAAVITS